MLLSKLLTYSIHDVPNILISLTVIMPMHTCLAVGVWPLVIEVLLCFYNTEDMPMAIVIYSTVAMVTITRVTNC